MTPRLRLPWGRAAEPTGHASRSAASGFAPSSFAEVAWQRTRQANARWAAWGAALGAVLSLLAFAPASWLASAVASATQQRLLLAEAQGTVWRGSAVPTLTGGADTRDAAMLPGRLHWSLSPSLSGLKLALRQACCISGELVLHIKPGLGRVSLSLPARPDALGQWPAGWLAGLGTPWNTLQLGGSLRVLAPNGLTLESVQGRWRVSGGADFELLNVSSRLSTLDNLGIYRLQLRGNATGGDATTLQLLTTEGALQLTGNGQWADAKLRFNGEARAAPGQEAALANLLNIIARRRGDAHIISIG